MTLTDTGPLVAILDRDDAHHARCSEALPRLRAPLVCTWPVFVEAMHLLGIRVGWSGQDKLWGLLDTGELRIQPLVGPQLNRAYELMAQYQKPKMDLADATLVALAESLRIDRVFTIDGDFRIYRLYGRKPIRVVP